MPREESHLRKNHGGVHKSKEKDTNLYFSLPASREDDFFYSLHDIFLRLYYVRTPGSKLKTCSYRARSESPKPALPTASPLPSVHPDAFSNVPPPVNQGGHPHRLVNGSSLKMYICGTFNKMRGKWIYKQRGYFLGDRILIGLLPVWEKLTL